MAAALRCSSPAGKPTLQRVEDAMATPPRPSFLSPRGAFAASRHEWCAPAVEIQPDTSQRVGQSDFIQKARAPMATEEFERILSAEREHWLGSCLQEVRAVMERGKEEAADAALQERLAASAEAQSVRASLREQAERLAAARAAGAEDSARAAEAIARLREEVAQAQSRSAEGSAEVAELRAEARASRAEVAELRAEVALLRSPLGSGALEVAQAQSRSAECSADVAELRAEARASRAEVAELRAEVAQLRSPPGGYALEAIEELRASVAQLRSAAVGQEEPVRRLAELSGELSAELEQARASTELAHQRISELGAAGADVAELRADLRCLQESSWARDAAAEVPGDLDLTLPCAGAGDACPPGQPCCGQQEAVADLWASVDQLAARFLELERREEAVARKAAADMLELANGLEGLSAAQGDMDRRLGELAVADAARGPGGDAEAQIGSLRRLLQDQRRQLTVLSSELGSVRERCAAGADRDTMWGAVCERVADIEGRLAGAAESPVPTASTLAGTEQTIRAETEQKMDELAETLPTSRSEPLDSSQRLEEEQLPTLPGRTSTAPPACGVSPKGGCRPAAESMPHGPGAGSPDGCPSPRASTQALRPAPERGTVSDRLKDSLEGVVNAVQKVLEEQQQQPQQERQLEPAPAPPGQVAARGPQFARQGIPVQAPAAWRLQAVVATRAASPAVRVATALPAAVAPPRRAPGGSVVVPPGTPLLIRR